MVRHPSRLGSYILFAFLSCSPMVANVSIVSTNCHSQKSFFIEQQIVVFRFPILRAHISLFSNKAANGGQENLGMRKRLWETNFISHFKCWYNIMCILAQHVDIYMLHVRSYLRWCLKWSSQKKKHNERMESSSISIMLNFDSHSTPNMEKKARTWLGLVLEKFSEIWSLIRDSGMFSCQRTLVINCCWTLWKASA